MTRLVWSTPVIFGVAPAPVFAASACDGFSLAAMPGSGTSGNGWTRPTSSNIAGNGANGFFTNAALGTGYALVADATSTSKPGVVVIQTTATLVAGRTYTFRWNFVKNSGNPRKLTCDFLVGGVVQAGGLMDSDSAEANYATLSRSVAYAASTTGQVTIGFRFTFQAPATSNVGDDMQVYSPTASCG